MPLCHPPVPLPTAMPVPWHHRLPSSCHFCSAFCPPAILPPAGFMGRTGMTGQKEEGGQDNSLTCLCLISPALYLCFLLFILACLSVALSVYLEREEEENQAWCHLLYEPASSTPSVHVLYFLWQAFSGHATTFPTVPAFCGKPCHNAATSRASQCPAWTISLAFMPCLPPLFTIGLHYHHHLLFWICAAARGEPLPLVATAFTCVTRSTSLTAASISPPLYYS